MPLMLMLEPAATEISKRPLLRIGPASMRPLGPASVTGRCDPSEQPAGIEPSMYSTRTIRPKASVSRRTSAGPPTSEV